MSTMNSTHAMLGTVGVPSSCLPQPPRNLQGQIGNINDFRLKYQGCRSVRTVRCVYSVTCMHHTTQAASEHAPGVKPSVLPMQSYTI